MCTYFPISEQGTPSELTAAVLYLPKRLGDGGEKGGSNFGPKVSVLRPTVKPIRNSTPAPPKTPNIIFCFDNFLKNKHFIKIYFYLKSFFMVS